MRVATRRLRSSLATFRPLFQREQTEALRAELKWLGDLLGAARDAEVMHQRLRALVAAEPPELLLGPVLHRVDVELTSRYRDAREELLAELDGTRYFRLLDALDALVATPPVVPAASEPASDVLPVRVRKAWKRTRRAADAAEPAPTAQLRVTRLHEVRKAAKRARYAAEAVAPSFGRPAKRFARLAEEVQEILGEHHDSVVTRDELRRMGVQAHLDGENGFTFGRLHAIEQARGERAEAAYAGAWARLARKKRRRWLAS
jgi:CHAD domain-containing protein